MMSRKINNHDEIRSRNPFLDPLVTELIEDPELYRRMFSESILVGETLQVFQPVNAVLLGPQGSGKSMILNLIRYRVIANWLSRNQVKLPRPLRHVKPFLGISMNFTRAGLHAFGRRSISRTFGHDDPEKSDDISSAADFLNQFLFREFLGALKYIFSPAGKGLREWLGLPIHEISDTDIAKTIASWKCWFGFYSTCNSIDELLQKCEFRLDTWRKILNTNLTEVPLEIWQTKSEIGVPLHAMGNMLRELSKNKRLPLYVVLDQYEVLPELNKTHGTLLQRLVNTLIKSRDPVVFYKLGARTYDWGNEVRIWGSESRIEVQRDYVLINLSDVLMRNETEKNWLFPDFALDVAYKRIREEGHFQISRDQIPNIFGPWSAETESQKYFRNKDRRLVVLGRLNKHVVNHILRVCGQDSSPLVLRLAAAWIQQRLQRKIGIKEIIVQMNEKPHPWQRSWWKKERIGIALLQIASIANQRKLYYGWNTVKYLAGGNITAFLMICNEIWDVSTRRGYHPLKDIPLDYEIQTEGVYAASTKWRERDKNEKFAGAKRYEVLGRLGPAISNSLIEDHGMSNPGHSGFSLRESELWAPADVNSPGAQVSIFLKNAVSWAIFEERPHTSKNREAASRRKWYLHPLLSPIFNIPFKRVKEPLYTNVNTVYSWIFGDSLIEFSLKAENKIKEIKVRNEELGNQLEFKIDEDR